MGSKKSNFFSTDRRLKKGESINLAELHDRMVTNKIITDTPELILPDKVILDESGTVKKVEDSAVKLFNLDEGLAHRAEVEKANAALFENRNPLCDRMVLLGNRVLVRMFQLQKYTKEGFLVGGRTHEIKTESEMRKKIVEMDEEMQYQDRGVVIAVSSDCTEAFKAKVKPGDVVDIDPHLFMSGRSQRWLEKDNTGIRFDNYFLIPEHAVEYVILKEEVKES